MAQVPVLPPVTGGVYTTSQLSAVVQAVAFLQAPPTAQLRQQVAQSVPNTTFTSITFDLEDVDKDPTGAGGHSTSSNTSRYTAVYSGWYEVTGAIAWTANATGRRASAWVVNGGILNGSQQAGPATAASDAEVVTRTMLIFLNVSDVVELQGYQESGGALNTLAGAPAQTNATASIRWVST